jgi:hypothetical protein
MAKLDVSKIKQLEAPKKEADFLTKKEADIYAKKQLDLKDYSQDIQDDYIKDDKTGSLKLHPKSLKAVHKQLKRKK